MPTIAVDVPEKLLREATTTASTTSRTAAEVLALWLADAHGISRNAAFENDIPLKNTRVKFEHILERHLFKHQSSAEISEALGLAEEQTDAAIAFYHARPIESLAHMAGFFNWRNTFEAELEARKSPDMRKKLQERLSAKAPIVLRWDSLN